jgi:hypothetical protein
MSRQSSTVDYHRPPPRDRWQLWRAVDILATGCVAMALYCGFMSFVISYKLAAKTPAYLRYKQSIEAQAATQPAGTAIEWPQFNGQMYVPRPLFSLLTTYLAIGFASAGLALFTLSARRRGRAG